MPIAEGQLLEHLGRNVIDLRRQAFEPVEHVQAFSRFAQRHAGEDLDERHPALDRQQQLAGPVDDEAALARPLAAVAQLRGLLDPGIVQTGDFLDAHRMAMWVLNLTGADFVCHWLCQCLPDV